MANEAESPGEPVAGDAPARNGAVHPLEYAAARPPEGGVQWDEGRRWLFAVGCLGVLCGVIVLALVAYVAFAAWLEG